MQTTSALPMPHPDLQQFTQNYPMLEEIADQKLEGFEENVQSTVQSFYYMDAKGARKVADETLSTLPSSFAKNPSPLVDAIIGWKMLKKAAEVLRQNAREAKMLREGKDPAADLSAAKETPGPVIDDKQIRDSAGYTKDAEVADSSLTDKARKDKITDDDISDSAREHVVYEDKTPHEDSPATIFRREGKRLFTGIVRACLDKARLALIIDSGKDTQQNIAQILATMRRQMEDLKIPNPDDQMQG